MENDFQEISNYFFEKIVIIFNNKLTEFTSFKFTQNNILILSVILFTSIVFYTTNKLLSEKYEDKFSGFILKIFPKFLKKLSIRLENILAIELKELIIFMFSVAISGIFMIFYLLILLNCGFIKREW
jgi:hypothetical protein